MTDIKLPSPDELVKLCAEDGDLMLAARNWDGGVRFNMGEQSLQVNFIKGVPTTEEIPEEQMLIYSAPPEIWGPMLQKRPQRLMIDVNLLVAEGYMEMQAGLIRHSQYYSVVARLVELLREPGLAVDPVREETKPNGSYGAPAGKYIHLDLAGLDYRIYYEEAGVGGIPMLLQHTAGCHGSQFRHLFENPEITKDFHLIAYDLPFHGKSLPPVDDEWWSREYKLTGEFVRAFPVKLAETLGLDRPVFMGCSVGGMLAIDLAYHAADTFSHCISLEGALKVPHVEDELLAPIWHQEVSNEFKARFMNGIMSPTSPERYRKEVQQIYASGWPNLFLGDLYYYNKDYDMREHAKDIDTEKCGLTILSGEYDASGTVEMGREAHEAIAGSEFIEMPGMGHFPMSENPVEFMKYLQPVLDKIVAGR